MNIGKALTIFTLSASILATGCSVGTQPQELAQLDQDQPRAEMVVEDAYKPVDEAVYDAYNPVHDAGFDAIQKETTNAGIGTIAPMEIHERLSEPSVEGLQDAEMGTRTFSARFESASGDASYEVVCTNEGVGDGLVNGSGPLIHTANGYILQQTGAGGSCQVVAQGMSQGEVVHMTSSLHTFAPDFSGALIAH
jgi:hypothetical protein